MILYILLPCNLFLLPLKRVRFWSDAFLVYTVDCDNKAFAYGMVTRVILSKCLNTRDVFPSKPIVLDYFQLGITMHITICTLIFNDYIYDCVLPSQALFKFHLRLYYKWNTKYVKKRPLQLFLF